MITFSMYTESVHDSVTTDRFIASSGASSVWPTIAIPVIGALVVAGIGWMLSIWLTNRTTSNADLDEPTQLLHGSDLKARGLAALERAATQAELGELQQFVIPLQRAADRQSGTLSAELRTVAAALSNYIAMPAPTVDDVASAYFGASTIADVPAELTIGTLVSRTEQQTAIRPKLAEAIRAAEDEIKRLRRI